MGTQANKQRAKNTRLILQQNWALRALLSPLSFESVCTFLSRVLQEDKALAFEARRLPPHLALQTIEAAAAYSCMTGGKPMNDDTFTRLCRFYSTFKDPEDKRLLKDFGSVSPWLIKIERQQFRLQSDGGYLTLGRPIRLFDRTSHLAKTDAALQARHGIGIDDWLAACCLAWAATRLKDVGTIDHDYVAEVPTSSVAPARLQTCLSLLSWTPLELRTHFHSTHPVDAPLQWSTTATSLAQRPLIQFDWGWIAPLPNLLVPALQNGLYELARDADEHSTMREIGDSLENYVSDLFHRLPQAPTTLRERAIARRASGGHCDCIFEFAESIVLVECKGIQSTRRTISIDAFVHSGETRQLAKAFRQVHDTATDIRNGRYDDLLSSSDKPLVAIIATYGTFPSVNHEWYLNHILLPRYSLDNRGTDFDHRPLAMLPQVFDLNSLDHFASWLAITGGDPGALIQQGHDHLATHLSEWSRYLNTMIAGHSNPLHSFWREPIDRLWAERFEFTKLPAESQ